MKIWRYMDICRFVNLLSRGLHFTQPIHLGDQWEGADTLSELKVFRDQNMGLNADQASEMWKTRMTRVRNDLCGFGVSCWHKAEHESAALWQLYSTEGAGVAVQSTEQAISDALTKWRKTEIRSRAIDYIDFHTALAARDVIERLSRKRVEFAHEREVRFIMPLRDDECVYIESYGAMLSRSGSRWLTTDPTQSPLIGPVFAASRSGPDSDPSALKRCTGSGVYAPIGSMDIIHGVYLYPRASTQLRHAVIDILEKFGFSRTILKESSLDLASPSQVRFY